MIMGFEIEKIANTLGGNGNGFEIERIAENVSGGGSSGGGESDSAIIAKFTVDFTGITPEVTNSDKTPQDVLVAINDGKNIVGNMTCVYSGNGTSMLQTSDIYFYNNEIGFIFKARSSSNIFNYFIYVAGGNEWQVATKTV